MKMFFKRPRDFIKRNAETIALAVFMTLVLTEACYADLNKTTTSMKTALEGTISAIVIFGGLLFGFAKAIFGGNLMFGLSVIGCVILFAVAKLIIADSFVLFPA